MPSMLLPLALAGLIAQSTSALPTAHHQQQPFDLPQRIDPLKRGSTSLLT
jgi:hypothetical protein